MEQANALVATFVLIICLIDELSANTELIDNKVINNRYSAFIVTPPYLWKEQLTGENSQ